VRSEWPPAGSYNRITLTDAMAGGTRDYILQVPSNYDNQHPYRLIFAIHWNTGSAMQVTDCHTEGINCFTTQSPMYGLWQIADSSTIFVAPDGLGAAWPNPNNRDVRLIDDILTAVEADLCIDTSRIFSNGFSFGGAMSYTLAVNRPNVFRAVAIYDGDSNISNPGRQPTGPIAAYITHGTMDGILGYNSGVTIRHNLATADGCMNPTMALPLDTEPAGTHMCFDFMGCSAGHPVHYCSFGRDPKTSNNHTPSPFDTGAASTWQPREAWKFITQF
jgi:poly(3-hydroxybutyrate) depolymerase